MKILFTGDISLNDDYIEAAETGENPFLNIENVFKNADLVIGNLEAVCASDKGENLHKSPRLKTSLKALEYLNKLNVGLATLANNHVYDNLEDGLNKTLKFLEDNNIQYIGADSIKEQKQYKIIDIGGYRIAFLNYVHPLTNPNIPSNASISLNVYDKELIIKEINQIKPSVDFLILILHWGIDNSFFPAPWQRSDAKNFVNCGADFIIGHHSHTIQGAEKIGKSTVYYGLGNFAFSGFSVKNKRYDLDNTRHRNSFVVELNIKDNDYTVNTIPIKLEGLNVVLSLKPNLLFYVNSFLPIVSNIIVWPIYVLYLKYIYRVYFYLFGNNRNPVKQLRKLNSHKVKKYFQLK